MTNPAFGGIVVRRDHSRGDLLRAGSWQFLPDSRGNHVWEHRMHLPLFPTTALSGQSFPLHSSFQSLDDNNDTRQIAFTGT